MLRGDLPGLSRTGRCHRDAGDEHVGHGFGVGADVLRAGSRGRAQERRLDMVGKERAATGTSWLDRQWGSWDWTKLHRWTWMAIQLGNGESVNLWDLFSTQGEEHWATVLHPDGSESIVSVVPLAPRATDFATSPTTGQRYAGQWTVGIPSLMTTLTVTATPTLQEIQARSPFTPGIDEAASTVTGTYHGLPVTGLAYVEQFGIWH
jgi:predicted secreted hydrolase